MHSKINQYIETLTCTRLQACCSQIVTSKILNSSPGFGVDRHFLYDFSFHHEHGSFRGCNCSVVSSSFIFFFNGPFYADTYRTFLTPLLIFQAHFFCFCNTCLFVTFRTSFGVVGPNIFLLNGFKVHPLQYNRRNNFGPD